MDKKHIYKGEIFMSYKNLSCDNIARYHILTKPGGLTFRDICSLLGCSKTAAQKIIIAIGLELAKASTEKFPVKGRVTRESFCKHMHWDFAEIQFFAHMDMNAIKRKSGCNLSK